MNRDSGQHSGVLFGRYLIRGRLGRGGMGEVFLAEQIGPLGPVRPVALKRMLPQLADDDAALRMFFEEMRTAAQLSHPNIATTYDFGEIDGVYFLAMEYVEGVTLSALIRGAGPLPIPETLEIVRTIADALSHAHTSGGPAQTGSVVHSDVSPQNIMVSSQGTVKLLDFGIARTEAAVRKEVRAKLSYAAPEQLRGAVTDRRFDLWALGVVLYEALTAVRPFEGGESVAIVEAAEGRRYRPLSLLRPEAAAIEPLLARALEPDPEKRWNSAQLFSAALRELQRAHPPVHPERLARLVRTSDRPVTDEAFYDVTGTDVALSARIAPHSGKERPPPEPRPREPGGADVDAKPRDARAFAELTPDAAQRTPSNGALDAGTPVSERPSFSADWRRKKTLEGTPLPSVAGEVARAVRRDLGLDATSSRARLRWGKRAAWAVLALATVGGAAYAFRSRELPSPIPRTAPPVASELPERTGDQPQVVGAAPSPSAPSAAPSASGAPQKIEPLARSTATAPRNDRADRNARREGIRPSDENRKQSYGVLSVRTKPWARVVLDGRSLGEGVVASQPIPAGTHSLTITPGDAELAPRTFDVDIKVGIITKVMVDFRAGTLRIDPP